MSTSITISVDREMWAGKEMPPHVVLKLAEMSDQENPC